jgi:hypothetical protein
MVRAKIRHKQVFRILIVRRGQNENAVPAERAALCSRPSRLVSAPGQNKGKTIILNKTEMHFAPNKALPLGK